ncbi:hypothetical protein CDL15_Pgr001279 [Punica granatum]|uniref:Trans-resveratrol di-O-methyltransferase-like n=1 Tax=Punica granatum TaxID=22663 RepID=A0A218WK38_PUNGR|nr:hypothetical protein CDL15_Pgr001279 [Punica granatum]
MESTNGEKTSDLRECQAQVLVWNQILSYINSMSLKCAVELGIPDVIHDHGCPMTLPDLVSALGIPQARAGFLCRLMRMLTHSGFFALQTDQQPRDDGGEEEERPEVSEIIDKCRISFELSSSVVDVGGGTGLLARRIADTFTHLEVTVLDLPHVVCGLEGTKTLKFLAGDMFDSIPPADIILLKWILHDWNDEEGVKILKRCKDAITSNGKDGGKVIVIDIVLDEKENKACSEMGLLFDMMMMAVVTGRERRKKEWAKLFLDAGFRKYGITPLVGPRCLIEVYP